MEKQLTDEGKAIERAIERDEWETARGLIQIELAKQPENHFWLSRLALTHYEQRNYGRALELSGQALAIAPECPLVLWDYAGALEMLDRPQEAIAVYERITARGIESLAYGQCGEGRARARGIFADCLYRMSHCNLTRGERDRAIELLKWHLRQRGPGCQSIYPISTVREELLRIET
jgi:tetratricopeptide (TPR) repeat protein